MALSDLNPAERHRSIGGAFTDRVGTVKNWDVPAPVAGWTARDVVEHVTMIHTRLATELGEAMGEPAETDVVAGRWRAARDAALLGPTDETRHRGHGLLGVRHGQLARGVDEVDLGVDVPEEHTAHPRDPAKLPPFAAGYPPPRPAPTPSPPGQPPPGAPQVP